MRPSVALVAFALIVPAELPDKTMVAALVLSTRLPPLPVWAGTALALFVQQGVAVGIGGALTLLPHRAVLGVSAALFALGAVLLLRAEEEAEEEAEEVREELSRHRRRRAFLTSFGVVFAAEWGDITQLLSASLTARYRDPLAVFVGGSAGLVLTAALAVLAGRTLLRWVPLRFVRYAAAALFAVLAVVTAVRAAA